MKQELHSSPTRFSVIIPCYNEQESIPELLGKLIPELEGIAPSAYELILVDDGSEDQSRHLIANAHRENNNVKGIFLSRNFGHQAAIYAGLVHCSGEYVGIMDADMQDPPAILSACYRKAVDQKLDLVYAVRKTRQAGIFKKAAYWLFYRIMRKVAEYPWPLDAGDFSVFNRTILDLIIRMPERVRVMRGMRFWVGLKQGSYEYDRPGRMKGKTKYSLSKLGGLASSSLVSFSNLPLRLASMLGVVMSVLSAVLILVILINRFVPIFTPFGYFIGANPGITTIVLLLLTMGSCLFLCLGIIGEYLGVVVKEIKRRPVAIVERIEGNVKHAQSDDLVLTAGTHDREDV